MISPRHHALALISLLISGCATPPPSTPDPATQAPVNAELLVNSLQCGEDIREPGVYWLTDTATLQRRYDSINQANPEARVSPPVLDFANERVVVVAMGQRPSSGYLLNLPEQAPMSDGRVLDITVAWQEPEPDSIQAQVMVNPCLLIRLPALETQRVRVLNQQGEVKILPPSD